MELYREFVCSGVLCARSKYIFRKFVVGFAFLVPDVKYNEAYLSFIFTHPEWRRAGIASFMLYHVIQVRVL